LRYLAQFNELYKVKSTRGKIEYLHHTNLCGQQPSRYIDDVDESGKMD
jgi:hypothetical protein